MRCVKMKYTVEKCQEPNELNKLLERIMCWDEMRIHLVNSWDTSANRRVFLSETKFRQSFNKNECCLKRNHILGSPTSRSMAGH